jgi:hypothetical protein
MASQKDIIPEVWNRMTPAQQLANAKKMGYNPQASQTLQTGTTPQSGTQTGTGYNPNYHPADSGNDMYTDPNGGHGYYPGGQAAHDAATGGTTAQPYAEAAYQTPWWENLTAFDPNSLPTQPTTNWGALLPGVPDPEAEAAKIQAAYDSLAGINRQDLRRQMENNSASDLARRGLGTSSLSENTGNAMDLWALTQEAKDRAQGLQAGRQWAQNLRGEKTNQLDLARGWQNQDYNTAMQRTITGEGLAAQRRGEASGNWWQNMNYLLGQQNTLGQSMNPSVFGAGMGSVANQYGNSAANLGGGNNNIFGSLLGGWAANQNNTAKPANITVNSGGGTSQPWSSGNTYANSAYTQSSGYKAPSWLGNNNFSVSF